jgi:hypothetical protein
MQRRDIRVVQPGKNSGFAFEPGDPMRIGREALGKNLERDEAAKPRVQRRIHFAHPTGSDERPDLIRPERDI